MRLHRTDRHVEREDQVAKKGKSKLFAVRLRGDDLTECAHFEQPRECNREPEESESAKCGSTERIVLLGIMYAGEELCEGSEENRPWNDEG